MDIKFQPTIRIFEERDIDSIALQYESIGYTLEDLKKTWQDYYQEQKRFDRTVIVIAQEEKILGYGSLLIKTTYPHFFNNNIPEIHDLWVHEKYRNRGFATQLIDKLEKLAKGKGYREVGLGVGLHAEYGAAQRLYIRLGYRPDGYGVSYHDLPTIPGKSYPLDDELILWLKKSFA